MWCLKTRHMNHMWSQYLSHKLSHWHGREADTGIVEGCIAGAMHPIAQQQLSFIPSLSVWKLGQIETSLQTSQVEISSKASSSWEGQSIFGNQIPVLYLFIYRYIHMLNR